MSEPNKPFTVACHVGRLIELRVGVLTHSQQQWDLHSALNEVIARVTRPIVCTDLRASQVVPAELADAGLEWMRQLNRVLYRSALLVPGPVLALQVARLNREANSPAQRLFETARELEEWLAPELVEAERERLHIFLLEEPQIVAKEPLSASPDPSRGRVG